jgi:CspA family cold shock protein
MITATVLFYNRAKGFGFAAPDNPGDDVFIHISNMPSGHKFAEEGDRISYDPGIRNGRPLALNIQFLPPSNGGQS